MIELLTSPYVSHALIFAIGTGTGWILKIKINNNVTRVSQENSFVGGDQVGRDKIGK